MVTTTGVTTNDSLIADVNAFLKDPTLVVVEALNIELEVQLLNLKAHFELDLDFDAGGTFTIPLLPPVSPLGVKVFAGYHSELTVLTDGQ